MRVWLCPSAFAPHLGGVEELTLKLGQHLQRRGHDVLVVTNRHPRDLAVTEDVEGLPVRRVAFSLPTRRPGSWLPHLRGRPGVRAALAALPPPDLVHVICMSSQTAALTSYAAARSLPLVLTTQGETAMDASRIYQRNPWLRRDLRRAAASAQALSACSDWARRHAATVAPAFAEARVVPNGVDVDDWRLPEPGPEPVFAAWGRHVPEKGLDLLVEAFGLVRAQVPTARLLIGGDGPAPPPSTPGVELLGRLDRRGVRAMLAQARVAVVPSRVEPFGIVALEALAAGRGLVYSVHGGLSEAAGPCGRAADPFDPEAFAAAMTAELRDPTPPEAGRLRVEELSWEQITGAYEDLYESALA